MNTKREKEMFDGRKTSPIKTKQSYIKPKLTSEGKMDKLVTQFGGSFQQP